MDYATHEAAAKTLARWSWAAKETLEVVPRVEHGAYHIATKGPAAA